MQCAVVHCTRYVHAQLHILKANASYENLIILFCDRSNLRKVKRRSSSSSESVKTSVEVSNLCSVYFLLIPHV